MVTFLIVVAMCILIGAAVDAMWGQRMRRRRRERWPDS